LVFGYFKFIKADNLSPEKAGEKALNFINQNILEGATAVLDGKVEKKNGLYCFKVLVNKEKYDTCVSLNGKVLFPQIIDMVETSKKTEEETSQSISKTEIPEIHLYTMSYCPYGNQAEEVMYPVQKLLGEKVKIEPHYVIYGDYRGGGPNYCLDKENKYCSMHGIDELKEDVRELCIYKYEPQKYWDFLMGVNKKCNVQDVEICWEGVAKEWEIDTTQVKNCQKNEALSLLEKEVELNEKYGVTGSPALLINGTIYQGSRTPEGYKTGICSGFQNPPAECSQSLENTASGAAGGCQ
jgi:glutaredoxin